MASAILPDLIYRLLVLSGIVVAAVHGATPPPAAVVPPTWPMPRPAVVGPPQTPPPRAPKLPAIIAFGDSIVDTGNNNYLPTISRANFAPYGKDFPGRKATGRFCDGRISIDLLASALGVKEVIPPYLSPNLPLEELRTGVTFASAGSGYDNATSRIYSAMTVERQLQLFMQYKAKVGSIPDKALYVLCWGSNDVLQHFMFGDVSRPEPEYSDFVAQRAAEFIQSMVDQGARMIAVAGVPPVGCLPSQRITAGGVKRQCATDRNQLALMVNGKLKQQIAKLNAKLTGVNIFFVDLYTILSDIIHRYQALGFKNNKDACCGYLGLSVSVLCNFASPQCSNTSQYVFWDGYHPTERAYKIVVDEIVNKYLRFLQ